MIVLVLQSVPKKDFTIVKVRKGATGGQMPRLSKVSRPVIPKDMFVELMKSATSSVEFSFNNIMYKQTDGVAMGSPLGPALANILLDIIKKSYFLKCKSLQHTSDMLTTRLPSSITKLKQMNF